MIELLQKQNLVPLIALVVIWLAETWLPSERTRQQRYPHAGRNLSLGIINSLLVSVLLASLLVQASNWAATNQIGALHYVELPHAVTMILAILLMDGWMYLWHRANHELAWLWRFHRVHHCDPAMDVTSAVRFHPGEIVISGGLRLLLIPVLGLTINQILLYDTLLLPVILFHHSNVRFPEPIDRLLRILITTPALHRIHHSRIQLETDSNYGSIFSFWDRLARTFRLRADGSAVRFGLDGFDRPQQQTFWGLLRVPFITWSSAKVGWSSPSTGLDKKTSLH